MYGKREGSYAAASDEHQARVMVKAQHWMAALNHLTANLSAFDYATFRNIYLFVFNFHTNDGC